ncbi:unnamed protein product [Callosobruchus maculatus]|uniref:Fucosyltransferase n=1 Tax=Callosobruchus maculatus TaxID=64391 RepID=A0A653BH36_CALMS|nr:unnamed protein product [Callosobruchus maculatus]
MLVPMRLSARRLIVTVACVCAVTLLVSLERRFAWLARRYDLFDASDGGEPPEEEAGLLDGGDDAEASPEAGARSGGNGGTYQDDTEQTLQPPPGKPWFMTGGTDYPTNYKGPPRLFPDEADGDRVVDQLMYVPEDYRGYDTPEKVILAYNGLSAWGQKPGGASFHGCPVNRCSLTDDRSKAADADAILYKDHFIHPGVPRPMHQFADAINWTATYRRDSDIVRQKVQNRDYAANKTKKVAWFVSNCGARNGRLAYARELAQYIDVDIYGTCGPLKCPRSDRKCFDLLDKEYKFYLAFENSNCRDYITEKFYVNGLGQNVLPIVMGARPEDYQRSAPEGSYIHVDEFASPAELAAYLHRLDKDPVLYNSYFKWKGTGEFINTYFWCRLCAMMHAPLRRRHYEDVNDWWRGPGVCTTKSWRNAEFV